MVPIAGRMPQRYRLAGKTYTPAFSEAKLAKLEKTDPQAARLVRQAQEEGIRVSSAGFPDLEPYAYNRGGKRGVQKIEYTGDYDLDNDLANAKMGWAEEPTGWTWHHHEDMTTLILIPTPLHRKVKHTGGTARYRHITGDIGAYR